MPKAIYSALILVLFLLFTASLGAQDVTPTPEGAVAPVTTPDPLALTRTIDPLLVATLEPTATVFSPTLIPPPTAQPGPPFPADALRVLIAARLDLDLLAAQQMGNNRPLGWSGNANPLERDFMLLARLDLELLAAQLLGLDTRPVGWFGAIPGTELSIARDIRHDLELLADNLIVPNVRPPGWTGDDPLLRCDRSTQALVYVLERGGVFSLDVSPSELDYCRAASVQASRFAAESLLNSNVILSISAAAPVTTVAQAVPIPGNIRVDSTLAVAYLNRYGTEMVGPAPDGEPIQPLGRSFAPFSRMVLVRGNGFEVFLDYKDTTLTDAEFASLPDVGSVPNAPACNAPWCRPVTITLGNPASRRGD